MEISGDFFVEILHFLYRKFVGSTFSQFEHFHVSHQTASHGPAEFDFFHHGHANSWWTNNEINNNNKIKLKKIFFFQDWYLSPWVKWDSHQWLIERGKNNFSNIFIQNYFESIFIKKGVDKCVFCDDFANRFCKTCA